MLGCKWMGFEPKPHQLLIAAVLEDSVVDPELGVTVPRYRDVAVCVPRRAGKTTSIWPVLIGRALARPGYVIVTTAQSGVKARERFMDAARRLERQPFPPYKIKYGVGHESIEFHNGSRIIVRPPEGQAFRGDEADLVLFDESQEYTPARTEELVGAVYPLLDTRPEAQVIIAGTAGSSRQGMLWDALEAGRKGLAGIVEYALEDDADPTKPASWRKAHPGIGTLTTLRTIEERFNKLPLTQFQREYCGQWPFDVSARAIDERKWAAAREAAFCQQRPEKFAAAFEIDPQGRTAALAVAWRDEAGRGHVEIIDHRVGSHWVQEFIARHAMNAREVPWGYDHIGTNGAMGDALLRARPRPRLFGLGTNDMKIACARFMSDLAAGKLVHYGQPSLEEAVRGASKRPVGDSWLWNRRGNADIVPLVAATVALRIYDTQQRPRTKVRRRTT